MVAPSFKISICLAAVIALAGCSTRALDRLEPRDIVTIEAIHPTFVTQGGELQEAALRRRLAMGEPPTWEASRNDGPVFDADAPAYASLVFLEVRHREHLRTINGRPREFSTTITRSIRREWRD